MIILSLLTSFALLSSNCATCPSKTSRPKKIVVEKNSLSNIDRARLEQKAPETLRRYDSGKKMKVSDVIALSQAGISDNKIIYIIQSSDSHYNMTSKEVYKLKNAGLSQYLIDYMINYT